MDRQTVLSRLLGDLRSFLSLLDSEKLSFVAQAQRKSISELLVQLQGAEAPDDAEYMIMNCPSLSPSNEQLNTPGTGAGGSELVFKQDSPVALSNGSPGGPPLPPGSPGGDEDDDEDTYEEAEPYVADRSVSNAERAESDSSHYESYGEEDNDEEEPVKDRAHYIQWSASQPCLRPTPESRICGYLWRRRWLGQWVKQLFLIRQDVLLCYKCAQDLLPQLELNLRGCHLVYKSRWNQKVPHQLKLVLLGSETLVLGYSSFQQADDWRKVIQEVSGGDTHAESSQSDQLLPCRSGPLVCEDEDAPAGRSLHHRGYLSVMMNCQWQSLLCQVDGSLLNMFGEEQEQEEKEEEEEERPPQCTIPLPGCRIRDGPDTEHSYRITLSSSQQVALLEVSSSEEKQRWLKVLRGGAAHGRHHGNKSTQDSSGGAFSGLHKFPTSNSYMDKPVQERFPQRDQPVQERVPQGDQPVQERVPQGDQPVQERVPQRDQSVQERVPQRDQPVYSNSSVLEQQLCSSQDCVRCSSASSRDSVSYSNAVLSKRNRRVEVERGVQKLELTGRKRVQLRAESEVDLSSAGRHNKRTSFRQSLAVCSERAQAALLNPLLRRTASAKTSLRPGPSALLTQHSKVFQRRKELETKAAA